MADYKVVDKNGVEVQSAEPIHPGEILLDELEAREIPQNAFAKELGMKASHLNEIIHGKRNISPSMALKLETLLEISASFWVRLQAEYDLDKVRLEKASV
ncbi:HigA family addiction module antitoxin [Catalinimonas sp. 4WD22]|uniref:HigA family addiction module antitoxin n=1 Tax=Catalinimonas locisalis TaxID=3133978 RepID=UPI00310120C2